MHLLVFVFLKNIQDKLSFSEIKKCGYLWEMSLSWILRGYYLTNFVTMCAFFSKITTHWWWQVRYVSYRYHSKKFNNCTGISITQVVIDLWAKKWKPQFSHIVYNNFTTMVSTEIKHWFLSSLQYSYPLDTLSKVSSFFEKVHKVFKNKV